MSKNRLSDVFSHEVPEHSAPYHVANNLVVIKKDLAFRINGVKEGTNPAKEIYDLRLKKIIFNEIMKMYNNRKFHYDLNYNKISEDDIKKFKIIEYMYKNSQGREVIGGYYELWPKTFVCKKCGDLKIVENEKDMEDFDASRCKRIGCDGSYEQVSIAMFCETCGKVEQLKFWCKEHGKKYLKLIRPEKDMLRTWKVVCTECEKQGKKAPIDIFRFKCRHEEYGKKISEREETKQIPLTIKEGGVYTPVVKTTIVIPTREINIGDIEYILMALYMKKFSPEDFGIIEGDVKLEDIKIAYSDFNHPRKKERFILRKKREGCSEECAEKEWEKENGMDIIRNVIGEIKKKYGDTDIHSLNDYLALKGTFGLSDAEIVTYSEYLEKIKDSHKQETKKKRYETIKEKYGIEEITYVPKVNLVSTTLGVINGINRFYEENFVPHFEPFWKTRKRDEFVAYAHPFTTEGILIDLDKKRVCDWLIDNGYLNVHKPQTKEEAVQILLNIKETSSAYVATKTLVHTLSHSLINRSSLHTGLDSDSCGELIFVNSPAILIYSTSPINIGGFEFVFENALYQWFDGVEMEIRECSYDPTCIYEKGACFSCMYLPEYVCSEFNQYLDRDAFIASTNRYSKPYW